MWLSPDFRRCCQHTAILSDERSCDEPTDPRQCVQYRFEEYTRDFFERACEFSLGRQAEGSAFVALSDDLADVPDFPVFHDGHCSARAQTVLRAGLSLDCARGIKPALWKDGSSLRSRQAKSVSV